MILDGSATDHGEQPCVFDIESNAPSETLDGFIGDVTTIAQLWCERATDYADIETLVGSCIAELPARHQSSFDGQDLDRWCNIGGVVDVWCCGGVGGSARVLEHLRQRDEFQPL